MKKIKQLNLGFSDAENYKRRENKDIFNNIFIKNDYLDELLDSSKYFLVGEKGTGKTAYAVYLSNNEYKNTASKITYIRETDYQKFITIKNKKSLDLSTYSSIWKVIIYLLLSNHIISTEKGVFSFNKFSDLNKAINEYYASAFSPEISQALSFIDESKIAAELISKHARVSTEDKLVQTFSEERFQTNLFYIQKHFEDALLQLRLNKDHILFIDGIDIRPSSVEFTDYLNCIKGLANAIWEINNDFFPSIKGGKGRFKVGLLIRPDIFQTFGLQNQNTKIRANSVYLNWIADYNQHRTSSIFEMADNMLKINQDKSDIVGKSLGDFWDYYFPWNSTNYQDNKMEVTSFITLLRWSYHRPRDIVTMIQLLQKENNNGMYFTKENFENTQFQRDYSNYLLGEIKDHLLFYYDIEQYELFLKFFEYLKGQASFSYEVFLESFQEFNEYAMSSGVNLPKFMSNANEFLQFLFELNVFCYVEYLEEDAKKLFHWCFKERTYANISPKVKQGVEYQIFYGLAKALNLGKKLRSR